MSHPVTNSAFMKFNQFATFCSICVYTIESILYFPAIESIFSSQPICKSEKGSERGISSHQAGVLVRQAAFSKTLPIKTINFNILRWEQPGAMAPLQPLATPSKEQQLPSEKPSPRSRKLRLGSSSATSPRCGPPPFLERFHCLDCEVIVLLQCSSTDLMV